MIEESSKDIELNFNGKLYSYSYEFLGPRKILSYKVKRVDYDWCLYSLGDETYNNIKSKEQLEKIIQKAIPFGDAVLRLADYNI
jgi:hypothetical protein|tara:strand:+ start:1989 stop:2240 length:252 start_codon:yes stop_codon:yes gene_type:complete